MGKLRLQVLRVVNMGLFMGSEQRQQAWKVEEEPREASAKNAQSSHSEGSAPSRNPMSIGRMGRLSPGYLAWQTERLREGQVLA